jgi:subtilisin-like proprotein convertase family protein
MSRDRKMSFRRRMTRLSRGKGSTQGKPDHRRGLHIERLEDRSLLAADFIGHSGDYLAAVRDVSPDVRLPAITNATPITIPDSGPGNPYPSTINVSGLSGPVVDVDVTLHGLTHTWPDDLDVLLIGPGGQSVLLLSDVGGSGSISGIELTLDDAAADSLPDGSFLTSGAFQPTNFDFGGADVFPAPAPSGPYGSFLSEFNGSDPNGDWSLYVLDDAGADLGIVSGGWTLTITTSDGLPDLRGFQFVVNPDGSTNVFAGDPLELYYDYENVGEASAPATAHDVGYYLSTDATFDINDDYFLGFFSGVDLDPGGDFHNGFFNVTLPDHLDPFWQGDGTYYVGMIVDDLSTLLESDETNNSGRGEGIDYSPIQVTIEPPVSIEGRKWNDLNANGIQDSGEAGLAGWTIYLDADGNGQLDSGELSTVTDIDGNYAFTGLPAGDYTVAEVLPTGWEQTFPFPLPDLLGTGLVAGPTIVDAGATLTLEFEFENQGTADAALFDVGFYLSLDGFITTSDRLLSFIGNPVILAPGSSFADSLTVTLPANGDSFWSEDGTYYVGMVVDDVHETQESDESNNANLGVDIDIQPITVNNTGGGGGGTGEFQIDVVFAGGLTVAQQAAFTAAAARWEEIIIGDIPDVLVSGDLVDDVVIIASGIAIDGSGGILGQAGPTFLRSGSFLPASGIMQFDTADIADLEAAGQFVDVILHEMGHVIGIGTIWSELGLLSGAGGANPVFTGAQATAEYNAIFGASGTSVPVENTGGGGTRDSHWRESVFDNELMTGFLNFGVPNPISRVTAGQLGDLGYEVNINAADDYSPLSASSTGGGVEGEILALDLPVVFVEPLAKQVASLETTRTRDAVASLVQTTGYHAITGAGVWYVSLAPSEAAQSINFGNRALPSSIAGQQWNDLNGDGIKQVEEPGLEGWTIFLDDNRNGVLEPNFLSTFGSFDVPQDIFDDSTIFSQVGVAGLDTILDVNVTLDITHTYDGDLEAYLISPQGSRIPLVLFAGGNGDNFSGTTFDDEAASSINLGIAPFEGSFQPEGLLSDLDGENPNGVWTLEISDQALQDEGTLNSWSLTLETAGETSTTTDADGYYSFEGLAQGVYSVREVSHPDWTQTYPFEIEGYVASDVPFEFEDISATGQFGLLPNTDDAVFAVTAAELAGFEFDFYGTTFDSLFASSNGLINFGSGTGEYFNDDLTIFPAPAAIAPFWDDLILNLDTSPGASVLWEVRGSDDEQRLIVQWNEVEFYGEEGVGAITFQAVLNESDSSIQFNYLDLETSGSHSEGSAATVGVKNGGPQGSQRLVVSLNSGPNGLVGSQESIRLETALVPATDHVIILGPGETISAIDFGDRLTNPEPSADFDNDGGIGGRDFLAWQRGYGTAGATPADGDADYDQDVDGDDLAIWQGQYAGGSLAAVSFGSELAAEPEVRTVESLPPTSTPRFSRFAISPPEEIEPASKLEIAEVGYTEEVDQAFAELGASPIAANRDSGDIAVRRAAKPKATSVDAFEGLAIAGL